MSQIHSEDFCRFFSLDAAIKASGRKKHEFDHKPQTKETYESWVTADFACNPGYFVKGTNDWVSSTVKSGAMIVLVPPDCSISKGPIYQLDCKEINLEGYSLHSFYSAPGE